MGKERFCGKPKIKCADCPDRRFLQVTDDVIRRHLSGKGDRGGDFAIGIYPTSGRFRLNVSLPISFDGSGAMEVDLLCADARVGIELDGSQHLADIEAYRRDRRKDALLQQNGYLILRFLAEDVGKQLDDVLDAITTALTCRSKR